MLDFKNSNQHETAEWEIVFKYEFWFWSRITSLARNIYSFWAQIIHQMNKIIAPELGLLLFACHQKQSYFYCLMKSVYNNNIFIQLGEFYSIRWSSVPHRENIVYALKSQESESNAIDGIIQTI